MGFINLQSINLDIKGNTKEEILRELAKTAYEVGKVTSEEGFYEGLLKREEEVTTGFGFGFAVPHAKSKYAKEVGVLFGRSKNEIEWEALDGNPVSSFICLISPEEGANEHLKLLSKLSRKLMHKEFVEILKTGNEDEILSSIINAIEG
ncbi:MAG: PTS fructose transporter subunit IIA [Clostridium sp.]|uniref:PTS fructose transporter subunit IIA n=1 Tax=Clostridium sp. TaxID=1506 RepID=UPI003F31C89F